MKKNTKHEEKKKMLRKTEEKCKCLVESLDCLAYCAEPDTFVATYVNKAIEQTYGYTQKEWLDVPRLWEDIIYPEDKQRVLKHFEEAQKEAKNGFVEYRIVRKDEVVRWVKDCYVWEKNQNDEVVSFNGTMHDIAELKEIQNQFTKAEKMKTVSIMGVGIAHEIRNPLAILQQGIDYLKDSRHEDNKDIDDIFKIMNNSIKRINSSVIKLSFFSNDVGVDLELEDGTLTLDDCLCYAMQVAD